MHTANTVYNSSNRLHCDTGPAVEIVNVSDGATIEQQWYQNGQLHRDCLPAVTNYCGTEYWYQHGNLHRTDGPAVILPSVYIGWYINGLVHRTDGPAEVFNLGDGQRVYLYYHKGILVPKLWVTICNFIRTVRLKNLVMW